MTGKSLEEQQAHAEAREATIEKFGEDYVGQEPVDFYNAVLAEILGTGETSVEASDEAVPDVESGKARQGFLEGLKEELNKPVGEHNELEED